MLIEQAFKQGDVVGRVRRMRTQKRPLNLAALGVLGPAQGAAPESKHTKYRKNAGPRLRGADTLGKPRWTRGGRTISSSRKYDGTRQGRE